MTKGIVETKAPLMAVSRHRLAIDGKGVVTLVAFMGCPLKCKYCLNDFCHAMERTPRHITPQELLEEVMIDNLYFLATDGGITFGGGEPLLNSKFIEEFCKIADPRWTISMETSLSVPLENLQRVFPFVNKYMIDVKDMNPAIYEEYTKHPQTDMLRNLKWLLENVDDRQKIEVRLPHIPSFNTQEDVDESRKVLEEMGVVCFDEFNYIIPSKDPLQLPHREEGITQN